MLKLIIKHRYALLISLVISFIFFLPHIIIPIQIGGKRYDPLEFFGSSISMEEVYTYVPEVQEILEGKRWVSDTQLFEYKDKSSPYIGETFFAYLMSLMVKTTGSVTNAFVAAYAIFPSLAVYKLATTEYSVASLTSQTLTQGRLEGGIRNQF